MQAAAPPVLDNQTKSGGIFEPTSFNIWGDGAIDRGRTVDPNQPTFVITHGFWNTGGNASNNPEAWISEMANNLRSQNPNANIVVVDWDSRLLAPGSYPVMAARTGGVANEITQFLRANQVAPQETTLIGHSLGAQISGLVGQNFNGQIGTIFGLDPAGPMFEALPPDMRLSPGDAQRVVAIHSSRTFGTTLPLGALDIYLNPSNLFHPGSNNPVDNHGYATTFLNELLNGKTYGDGTVNQDYLYTGSGLWGVDTYNPNATPNNAGLLDSIIAATRDYIWNLLRNQYQDQNGKPIPNNALNKIKQGRIDAIYADIQTIGELLAQGKISLPTWQEETARALKLLYIELALLARGGADRMTRNDYLEIGRTLKEQYRFLRNFAKDISEGKVSTAQFYARLKLYVAKANLAFALMMQRNYKEQNYKYMQRFLHPSARTCDDCFNYARVGFQLIGELPLPTELCQCSANCECRVVYYRTLEEALLG